MALYSALRIPRHGGGYYASRGLMRADIARVDTKLRIIRLRIQGLRIQGVTVLLLHCCIIGSFDWIAYIGWIGWVSWIRWISWIGWIGGRSTSWCYYRAMDCAESCFWCLLGRFLSVSDRNLSPHQFIWLYHSMTAIAISATDICIR